MASSDEEEDNYQDCNLPINKHENLGGRFVSSVGIYTRRNISIKKLIKSYDEYLIRIPDFQRTLNTSKINLMIAKFNSNNDYYNYCTNPIQLAFLPDINAYLLIDGQHRFNMYKEISKSSTKCLSFVSINIINCSSIEEIYQLYSDYNIDNKDIIEIKPFQNIVDILKYKNLEKLILTEYKTFFLNKNTYIYSIDEFIKALEEGSFLIQFNSIGAAFKYIQHINKIYFDNFYTETNIKSIKLNVKEITYINSKIIFSFRHNNFLDLLLYANIESDDNFECEHYWIDRNIKKKLSNQFTK